MSTGGSNSALRKTVNGLQFSIKLLFKSLLFCMSKTSRVDPHLKRPLTVKMPFMAAEWLMSGPDLFWLPGAASERFTFLPLICVYNVHAEKNIYIKKKHSGKPPSTQMHQTGHIEVQECWVSVLTHCSGSHSSPYGNPEYKSRVKIPFQV